MTARLAAPDGKHPMGVAIDPSGRRVAVGYHNQPAVSILDATTLAWLARAQTDQLPNRSLSSVGWSHDGATLVAGGEPKPKTAGREVRAFLRRFDASGRRQGADIDASSDTIMDIQPCAEGLAFATAEPFIGLLSVQGVATVLKGARTANMQDKVGSALAVSRNASSVRFGLGDGEGKPVVFDLAAAALTDSPNLPSGLGPAQVTGLPVTDWEDSEAPKFRRVKLALDEDERSQALAIRPDASGFVLGADWSVRAYDAKGQQLWSRPVPSDTFGVDFSADGEILVVAHSDGTIRWMRWTDGEELLAFFVEPQTRKWVAWTPSGYYMASPGGEDLISWHINLETAVEVLRWDGTRSF